jgi:hypothetical protein
MSSRLRTGRSVQANDERSTRWALVVTEFVSLDGVFEDPGGAETSSTAAGRSSTTAATTGTSSPNELQEAERAAARARHHEGPCGRVAVPRGRLSPTSSNSDPKYAASTTLEHPEWQNTTVIAGNVADEIRAQGRDPGMILVAERHAGAVAASEADLVDELRLMVFPTILGRGKRLFPDGIDRSLRLAESRTVGPDGVQVQVYERAG